MAGLKMKYFILKPRSKYCDDLYAEASRVAMAAYADIIWNVDPELAISLDKWIDDEANRANNLPNDNRGNTELMT